MMRRALFTVGLSAMLAMPMLAFGQPRPTTPGMTGPGSRMGQPGRQETAPDQIREAQQQLKRTGLYRGSIDGQLGEQTREALREYHNLPQHILTSVEIMVGQPLNRPTLLVPLTYHRPKALGLTIPATLLFQADEVIR
jgi:Putative peptidoglycan binding domain